MQPRYIQVHPTDNVAIVVNDNGLPAGTQFDNGLILLEAIPEAHKVALTAIPEGTAVLRYGMVIGHANRDIPAGAWVHESVLTHPELPSLDRLPPPLQQVMPEPLTGFTFEGYVNDDGTVGTKNILGISTTVQCVAATVDYAVKKIKAELLPKYPNVDDVIAITHNYGCGIAIDAPGSEIPIRTLRNLSLNPNLGGAPMVVSLGCEKMQPDRMLPTSTLPILSAQPYVVRLQDDQHHSFGDMVSAIMQMADARLQQLNLRRRQTCPASSLVVGLQCGGSDAFSGVTAMFSEVTEVRDAIHLLTARATTPEVAQALIREMAWYDNYLANGAVDRSANPTPGNKRGGLTNIVEKALGSIAKSGTSPIGGVFGHGERVTVKGLVFAATPASDFVCGTLQLAAAMNMHIFTTGRGTPYGLAMVPVIKVSSRTALANRWSDLIDLAAGTIATGDATIQQVGEALFHLILEVASGSHQTHADHYGLHNEFALFNPSPIT